MLRTFSLSFGAALVALAATAHAEPQQATKLSDFANGTWIGSSQSHLWMVVTPPEAFNSSPPFEVSNVLYLNRCTGGCNVTGTDNVNDARMHISSYISPGPHVVSEYKNNDGMTGAAADAEWNQLVQCIREIYSPFNIVVQDTPPTGTGNYTEALIGGLSGDVGLSQSVGGVAPAHNSCEPNDNAMSYTFANNSYYFYPGEPQRRVWELCAVAGQESAHHYGLDHSYEFFDGTSACNDPMTYRTDCGGQKFFRNKAAKCGEDKVRTCFCGGLQNTHQKILSVFGEGPNTALIPPPTAVVNSPMNGATAIEGQVVAFQAGSKRGVEHAELYLNGWKWADVKGAAFGGNGQLNPSNYSTKFPSGVPNGVIDIQIKAYDDLAVSTLSAPVTVTKGAPCTSADACAKGQKCEAGKCFWDPPTGKLGDACDYQQFCETNQCTMTDQGGFCSQECIVGGTGACPDGFECVQAGSAGACLPADDGGGCCSVGGADAMWVHGGLSLGVLALVMRRRRRRDRL
jgi:hypothetical protein